MKYSFLYYQGWKSSSVCETKGIIWVIQDFCAECSIMKCYIAVLFKIF